jgi:hypothetical protein
MRMTEPTSYPELEIGLHRTQADSYQLVLRFTDPASDAEPAPVRTACALDPDALLPLQLEPLHYGQALAEQLFSAPDAGGWFGKVKAGVQSTDRQLRLRLLIDPTAAKLHALRWELLCDPETRRPLATSEHILFSRFMLSTDWRPIRLRPETDLRALIAVANPTDIDAYNLAAVDVEGEVRRAGNALDGIATQVLGQQAPLTVDALTDALRRRIDIFYLVAHGVLSCSRGPELFLQDPDGRCRPIAGDDLERRFDELREPPRLVVLASCDSAAVPDEEPENPAQPGTLRATNPRAALAPRLAAAGVPAIVAMQGQISMQTVEEAMPTFFAELRRDGQIDRAMAIARGRVRERPDAWMPALYLSLRNGRLWDGHGHSKPGIVGTSRPNRQYEDARISHPHKPSHTDVFVFVGFAAALAISLLWLLNLSFHEQSPSVGLLGVVLAVVTVVFAVRFYLIIVRPKPNLERNRSMLLEKIKSWIKEQYAFTLSGDHIFAFQFHRIGNAVSRPYAKDVEHELRQPLPREATISGLFDESAGMVLILGDPGSGKSRLLTELARELIARAERDVDLPVPFIFNLSSWAAGEARQATLAEWLVDELDSQWGVSPDLARSMISGDHLVLLLDGLDEVQSIEDRTACAKAINAFRREYSLTPVVVACRTTEYADLPLKLLLNTAIEVQPLSREQIDRFLAQCGDIRAELENALATDSAMRELAKSPLILPMMAEVYRDLGHQSSTARGDGDGDAVSSRVVLREKLFDAYIDGGLAIQTAEHLPRERLADWLVNLAQGMQKHGQQIFMIEQLQASWLGSARGRIAYVLLDRFVGGLVAALLVGLVVGASYGLGVGITHGQTTGFIAGWANGVRWGLVAGLVVALLGRTTLQQTHELSSRPILIIRRAILGAFVFVVAGVLFAATYLPLLDRLPGFSIKAITWQHVLADALFFAVVGAFGAAILHGPSLRPRVVQVVVSRRWSPLRGLPLGLAVGMAVAMISSFVYRGPILDGESIVFGVVYGLSTWIILGLVTVDLEPTAQPNRRIRRTLHDAIAVGLGVGLVSGLGSIATGFAVGEPVFGIYYGVSSAALVGLFGGIVSGRFAGISHFALRAILWSSRSLPWILPKFLDDLARRRLLRRKGSGYTFIHPLVAEHIASNWRHRRTTRS